MTGVRTPFTEVHTSLVDNKQIAAGHYDF